MTVLAVNKFYWLKGGAERYFFEVAAMLEAKGHRVVPFAMRHPDNLPSPWSAHFVSEVDFRARLSPVDRVRAAARVIHSREARRRVRALVRETRPAVAHLHNLAHQISPSILAPLRREGVPVVFTLHDYKLLCPTYRFFRDGKVCELCLGGAYLHATVHRCNEGSLAASMVNSLEMYLHRWSGVYRRHVDLFLAPSRFLRGKMIEGGVPEDKVIELPYCLRLERYSPRPEPGSYLLYAGRLSVEKGVEVLLDAMRELPGVELRIAGEGPLREALERRASLLPGGARVAFLGYQREEALRELVAGARLVVVPSVWYENSPLAIYEAFALGKPVVGARLGGIPELVEPGRTGELAAPGDAADLARAVRSLWGRGDLAELGREARRTAERRFDAGRHYELLLAAYRRAGARLNGSPCASP